MSIMGNEFQSLKLWVRLFEEALCWSLKPVLDLVDIELQKNKVIDIEII